MEGVRCDVPNVRYKLTQRINNIKSVWFGIALNVLLSVNDSMDTYANQSRGQAGKEFRYEAHLKMNMEWEAGDLSPFARVCSSFVLLLLFKTISEDISHCRRYTLPVSRTFL